jgi:peptidoglycan hydrolase CwlO-like protein
MIELTSNHSKGDGLTRIGSQPIALAAAALVVLVIGAGSIAFWRSYTGTSPEQERITAARQIQARTAKASEQLVEKTKGLEATQQESIDQLQVVQDQLQTVRRLLAAQQNETKRLSEQVGSLTGAIDGLRQSFASAAQAPEASSPPSVRKKPVRTKRSATSPRKRAKSRG